MKDGSIIVQARQPASQSIYNTRSTDAGIYGFVIHARGQAWVIAAMEMVQGVKRT